MISWIWISLAAASEAPDASQELEWSGELWLDLAAQRLDDLYVESPDAEPQVGFQISRAQWGARKDLGSAELNLQLLLEQDHGVESVVQADQTLLEVPRAAGGWSPALRDAWIRWQAAGGEWTLGSQDPCLGGACSYVERFFIPGPPALAQGLATRSGVAPMRVLGLDYRWSGASDRISVQAMIANTQSSAESETLAPKDLRLRLEGELVEGLRIQLSALGGPRGSESDPWEPTTLRWSSGLALDRAGWWLQAEALGAEEGETSALGWEALLGGQLERSGRLASWGGQLRASSWDPQRDWDDDAALSLDSMLLLGWDSAGSDLRTGLLYQVLLPQESSAAIQHNAWLQTRVLF